MLIRRANSAVNDTTERLLFVSRSGGGDLTLDNLLRSVVWPRVHGVMELGTLRHHVVQFFGSLVSALVAFCGTLLRGCGAVQETGKCSVCDIAGVNGELTIDKFKRVCGS
ncbi:hypothetical protein HPB47_008177 [Ixodes persulcatus]|uniref:Uncharacterized protein n=1 Tax=Ixodes persulcatus TaxID=34615 RepID=A0AC60P5E3_IXOPE|nr:hypothetical protein HPB47_008177 [Ixodes persulcatus]